MNGASDNHPKLVEGKGLGTEKNGNKHRLAVLVAVLAFAAVLGGIFLLPRLKQMTQKKKPGYSSIDECNFNNGGRLAYAGSKLYSIGDSISGEEVGLFVMDKDGTNPQKISSNEEIKKIRVIEGKIYYSAETDSDPASYSLGSMDLNGASDQTILKLERSVTDFDVVDSILYYVSGGSLCSISLENGQQKTLVAENETTDVEEFVIKDRDLYYYSWSASADYGLYKYDMENGTSKKVSSDSANGLVFVGNDLVYSEYNGIKKVSLDGGSFEYLVNEKDIANFTITGDIVYYIHRMSDADRNQLGIAVANSLGYTDTLMQSVISIMFYSYGSLIKYSPETGQSNDLSYMLKRSYVDEIYVIDSNLYVNASFFTGIDVIPLETGK